MQYIISTNLSLIFCFQRASQFIAYILIRSVTLLSFALQNFGGLPRVPIYLIDILIRSVEIKTMFYFSLACQYNKSTRVGFVIYQHSAFILVLYTSYLPCCKNSFADNFPKIRSINSDYILGEPRPFKRLYLLGYSQLIKLSTLT